MYRIPKGVVEKNLRFFERLSESLVTLAWQKGAQGEGTPEADFSNQLIDNDIRKSGEAERLTDR